MAAPVSVDDFLIVLTRSKLVEEKAFDHFLRGLEPIPDEPEQLAEAMIQAGLLTRFQVDNLLEGRWLRFFVGPYKVLERIGVGSTGAVYLCEHQRMRRRVAVKVLRGSKARDEDAVRRFEREARAASVLDHPNIVRAWDLAREDHLHYLVMDYVDGFSLHQLLLSEGPLAPERVVDYLRQAALGLQHAHEAGLIHRDLKPSNVMLASNGVIKLLDLGLARFTDDDTDLTRGAVLGCALFMAPEQAQDSHGVDARADVYSLGATFYTCLTGKRPQPESLLTPPPRPPIGADPLLFARALKLLRRMMAANPDDRPQTAGEVARTLTAWTTSSANEAAVERPTLRTETEVGTPPRSPSRILAAPRHPDAGPRPVAIPRASAAEIVQALAPIVNKPARQPPGRLKWRSVWLWVGVGAVPLAVAALVLYLARGAEENPGTAPSAPREMPKSVSPQSP